MCLFFVAGFFINYKSSSYFREKVYNLEKEIVLTERRSAIYYMAVLNGIRKEAINPSISTLEIQLKGVFEKEIFYRRNDFVAEHGFLDIYFVLFDKAKKYQEVYCKSDCLISEDLNQQVELLRKKYRYQV